MLWIVDDILNEGVFTIPVCIETDVRLYALFVGPPPTDEGMSPPVRHTITMTTPDGRDLAWRGSGARGDRVAQLLVAQFDPPPQGVSHLRVGLTYKTMDALDADETLDVAARLRRLT